MSGPEMGQPYNAFGGPRVSLGDLEAGFGTEAREGIRYLDPSGVPSFKIIPSGGAVSIVLRLRTAMQAFPVPLAGLTTEALVADALTGVQVAGSPFVGAAPAPIATPPGDHGPDGPGDQINWYEITFGPIAGLADGTYRVIIHGNTPSPNPLNFFHEDLFDVGGA